MSTPAEAKKESDFPKLSDSLFWDTNPAKIDWEKNARAVISRVMHRGTMEEWKEVERYYGVNRLKAVIPDIKWQDPKSENFFKLYYNL